MAKPNTVKCELHDCTKEWPMLNALAGFTVQIQHWTTHDGKTVHYIVAMKELAN